MQAFFDSLVLDDTFANLTLEKPVVVIAMTPRVGSSEFCAMLTSGSGSNVPSVEWLNPRGPVQAVSAKASVGTVSEYFKLIETLSGSAIILKTTWEDFADWSQLFPTMTQSLAWVFLYRTDLVAQAYSLVKARKLKIWHHRVNGTFIRTGDPADSGDKSVKDSEILAAIRHIESQNEAWDDYFATSGYRPIRFEYETMCEDWGVAGERVIQYLSEELDLSLGTPVTESFVKLTTDQDLEAIVEIRERLDSRLSRQAKREL